MIQKKIYIRLEARQNEMTKEKTSNGNTKVEQRKMWGTRTHLLADWFNFCLGLAYIYIQIIGTRVQVSRSTVAVNASRHSNERLTGRLLQFSQPSSISRQSISLVPCFAVLECRSITIIVRMSEKIMRVFFLPTIEAICIDSHTQVKRLAAEKSWLVLLSFDSLIACGGRSAVVE